jgi:hypothetical protein
MFAIVARPWVRIEGRCAVLAFVFKRRAPVPLQRGYPIAKKETIILFVYRP